MDKRDYDYMARALNLARRGLYTTHPNPRVGAVIVKDDEVVGEGYHQRAGEPHAEINALYAAGERAQGATVYITLEPCCHFGRTPPCTDALIKAGVKRVVVAMRDPNPQVAGQGLAQLEHAGIATEVGLLEAQARELNPGFVQRMTAGRPWVRVKLAMSLDGRTAMASGESQWITGEPARADVQRLRARSNAIMTGIGTVLSDDPSLNLRLEAGELGTQGEIVQPLRVVLDPQLQTPIDARLLTLPGPTLILTASEDAHHGEALAKAGAEVVQVPATTVGLDLHVVLAELAMREVNELQVEAGAILCGGLLQEGLIDELVIYMAGHLMGNEAHGLFYLPGLDRMHDRIALDIRDVRAVGRDWRITAWPVRG